MIIYTLLISLCYFAFLCAAFTLIPTVIHRYRCCYEFVFLSALVEINLEAHVTLEFLLVSLFIMLSSSFSI